LFFAFRRTRACKLCGLVSLALVSRSPLISSSLPQNRSFFCTWRNKDCLSLFFWSTGLVGGSVPLSLAVRLGLSLSLSHPLCLSPYRPCPLSLGGPVASHRSIHHTTHPSTHIVLYCVSTRRSNLAPGWVGLIVIGQRWLDEGKRLQRPHRRSREQAVEGAHHVKVPGQFSPERN
ncbi:hypothetical protein DFJ73DRAFT_946583, partial [Zopfochytrium polystomum]